MNSDAIKKYVAMGLGVFGVVALAVGFLTENEAWLVVGFMHLITASLFTYGQTLHKP